MSQLKLGTVFGGEQIDIIGQSILQGVQYITAAEAQLNAYCVLLMVSVNKAIVKEEVAIGAIAVVVEDLIACLQVGH